MTARAGGLCSGASTLSSAREASCESASRAVARKPSPPCTMRCTVASSPLSRSRPCTVTCDSHASTKSAASASVRIGADLGGAGSALCSSKRPDPSARSTKAPALRRRAGPLPVTSIRSNLSEELPALKTSSRISVTPVRAPDAAADCGLCSSRGWRWHAHQATQRVGAEQHDDAHEAEYQGNALLGNDGHRRHDRQHRHDREAREPRVAPHAHPQPFGHLLLETPAQPQLADGDRKSTRLNSSHVSISYAVFCLKKNNNSKV